MGRRNGYYYHKAIHLTNSDMHNIYNIMQTSLTEIKDIKDKDSKCVSGEIYTRVRRATRGGTFGESLNTLFSGSLKDFNVRFNSLKCNQKRILINMFKDLKSRRLSEEDECSVSGLERALFGMNASIKQASNIAKESEKVREGLEEIRKLLDESN